MIPRERYFSRLADGSAPVKLLTGIRRGGKSHLLRKMMETLRERGVDDAHIIYHDFENFVLPEIQNKKELQRHLENLLNREGKFYLFLDEIEAISGWEKTLAAFHEKRKIEFFIAASGTSLKKLARKKYFGSNWTEIKINPLSFSEYRTTGRPDESLPSKMPTGLLRRAMAIRNTPDEVFDSYVRRGGFPGVLNRAEAETSTELNSIYTSILFHDVVVRHKIKNVELLEKIIKHIFEDPGGECSANRLQAFFKSRRYTKNLSNIKSYLNYLEESFVIKRVKRLNMKTYKAQNSFSKYYVGDHALIFAVSGNTDRKRRGILENILVNELEKRGYQVFWGKYREISVDFVAAGPLRALYIQLSYADEEISVIEEKMNAMENVPSPGSGVRQSRYLVFFNDKPAALAQNESTDTIKTFTLPEFLLSDDY